MFIRTLKSICASLVITCPLSSCGPVIDISVDDQVPLVQEDVDIEDNTQVFDVYDDSIPGKHITVTTNQIMTLSDNYAPHPQGGDCWNDYFFQFSTDNNIIRIYDLNEKALIQKLALYKGNKGFVSKCHCNSVCFGSSYYKEGDEFPLLYVSTGYTSDGYSGALVYRVVRNHGLFSFSLVQTIRLPVLKSSWTEFITAGDYCYVCYTTDCIVYKMPLPSVHDGDVILDGSKDAIEVYQFPPQPEQIKISRNQGRLFHNGKLIIPSGVPQVREPSVLLILNLKNRAYEHIFYFPEMGLVKEPESVFIWNNQLCVAFLDQIVSIEFSPDILAQ